MNDHPGFKAVQSKIAKSYGKKAAGAILANASRKASPMAKKANPRLNRVTTKQAKTMPLSKLEKKL